MVSKNLLDKMRLFHNYFEMFNFWEARLVNLISYLFSLYLFLLTFLPIFSQAIFWLLFFSDPLKLVFHLPFVIKWLCLDRRVEYPPLFFYFVVHLYREVKILNMHVLIFLSGQQDL